MKLNFEDFYQQYLDTLAAYNLVISTTYVDQNTAAPKKGAYKANKALAEMARQAFLIAYDPETAEKIKEYAGRLEDGSLEKKELELRIADLEDNAALPAEVYAEFEKTKADAGTIWLEAKAAKDYSQFRPILEKVVNQYLNVISYSPRFKKGKEYDFLLDQFEKGMDQEQYDAFFEVIKEELPPLIQKVTQAKQIDTSAITIPVDVDRQDAFSREVLLPLLQADPGRVYQTTTEHPFTSGLSHNDVRITTHYYPERFLSAILSTVHEYGHALYMLQMDEDFEDTMLTHGVGSAAHESQSRFLENHIGRSPAFWKALYPSIVERFPEFKDITPEELVKMINVSVPGLIRTEADELTYPLHILIRYEIEKMMANGTLDYDALPEIWADKYEQYLGVRPANDKEGVLQDVHWSEGYLGYFPTYALGTAYAAQLYEAMANEFDPEKAIAEGNMDKIIQWLHDNVHHYANSLSMRQIVEKVSGKPFDPHIYTNYLKKKYSELYQLED